MKISKSEAGKLGYLASKKTQEKQKQQRIDEYYKNPSRCLFCDKELDYKHRHNKFCNQSCACTYNNLKRYNIYDITQNKIILKKKKIIKHCIVCEKELIKHTQHKFCSQECNAKYIRNKRYEKHILSNGDIIDCTEQTARNIAKDWLEEHNGHKCEICGNSEWLGKPILLIADHIDGDPTHNNIHNFRLICSNCDATLDTYKNKNKNKSKRTNRKKYYNTPG